MGDEVQVTYSLKEVLDEIKAKLDQSIAVSHGKADAVDVLDLKARMVLVEVFMKQSEKETAAKSHYREWIVPTMAAVALVIISLLPLFHL